MTTLWPRLPMAVTSEYLRRALAGEALEPTTSHPKQVYAEVGERVRAAQIDRARTTLVEVAMQLGFPEHELTDDRSKNVFDRTAADRLVEAIDVSWSEAANRELWNFVTFVVLPDLTRWRWSSARGFTDERWVARDLMRHTWARLWWQATTFGPHGELLARVQESELNQLFERRVVGGEPDLVVATTRALLDAVDADRAPRRELFREVTKRLRRALVFLDTSAMTPDELAILLARLVDESVAALSTARAGRGSLTHLHLDDGRLVRATSDTARPVEARHAPSGLGRLVQALHDSVTGKGRDQA